ncbi:E3 UFM1-protein ligase 1 homolog isoform X1 [Dendrobium catenatum]|uniref:E3 UFM1-protein ligase 1 homolog isoform X1 n=2 Tax=Dendrobium catenatum TaxID=906689 RepID=UPI0009F2EE1C|nr:E3 UFM1-protein ligase 1 homolog isoform X1 [Dendrobium catenatum]
MDAELLELQRQFESAQQAKSSNRLSERNIVELILKLQELRFIDFDLLHTVSGKEYITTEQVQFEMVAEIRKSGRVSLIDLSDVLGVDLYHIEKQGQQIVASDPGLMLLNGEIISESYWDGVAEEINEKLQECSQIFLAEIAAQLHVGSEIVMSVLEPRLGTIIKGRLEGGQLFTPAYVSRITAMVRGAVRGITVPTNLPTVWNSLQHLPHDINDGIGVSIENTLFHSIFNALVKEKEILGSLRAGVQWTPTVFAHAQRESVDSFFSQNSYIGYDVLLKLAIVQPKQYLQSRYPEGIALDSIFIHPSMVEMLNAAIQDAIEHGNWIDALSLLPECVGSQDVLKILSLCPSVQRAVKSSDAIILGDYCVFSSKYIKDLFDLVEKEVDILSFASLGGHRPDMSYADEVKFETSSGKNSEIKETFDDGVSTKHIPEKGSKKKRGKHTAFVKVENDSNTQESPHMKGKKNQRRSKDASSVEAKGSSKVKVASLHGPSEEWIAKKILAVAPDLGELGGPDDPHAMLSTLSSHLRPSLLDSLEKRRTILLQEHAKRSRQLLDNLQKQLDEAFLELQFYERALDLFEDDPSLCAILHRHLLKTLAAPIIDKLLQTLVMDNKLKNGIEMEEGESLDALQLTSANRIYLAKSLPNSLSLKAQAVVEAFEGKRVDTFMATFKALAEESGLLLKKLDKKLEKSLLQSYRKGLTSQVSSETDPVVLLPKIVALLYLQVYNKAFQAPGRAISAAVSRLKDKFPEETFKVLMDYHSATVTLLALQSTVTEDEEDCKADRILSKKEYLESKMPELKGLVLKSTNSGAQSVASEMHASH